MCLRIPAGEASASGPIHCKLPHTSQASSKSHPGLEVPVQPLEVPGQVFSSSSTFGIGIGWPAVRYGLNVCAPPPNSYVEILPPHPHHVTILGSGAFGR